MGRIIFKKKICRVSRVIMERSFVERNGWSDYYLLFVLLAGQEQSEKSACQIASQNGFESFFKSNLIFFFFWFQTFNISESEVKKTYCVWSIFQTFWKDEGCAKFLFFELETSNFGYLLFFWFPLTAQSFSKIGQHWY